MELQSPARFISGGERGWGDEPAHRRQARLGETWHGDGPPALVGVAHGRGQFEADPGHCATRPGLIRYIVAFSIIQT
jgi:hypothetical protein